MGGLAMASENTSDRTLVDRLEAYASTVSATYDRAEARVRKYTPKIVRTVEVVLAIALLAALAHWIYWVYILGT